MNIKIIKFLSLIVFASLTMSCNDNTSTNQKDNEVNKQDESDENYEKEGGEENLKEVHLSNLKFESLDIKVDTIPKRPISGIVYANGELEVPPQYEATVTAILGGNITAIKVIEGDKVEKGQVLAYLAHPDLNKVQSDYLAAYNKSQYLEQEYNREKRLNEEGIGSGKKLQQTKSEYQTVKAEVNSYEAQLKQLSLNVSRIKNGNTYEQVPVVSPIEGYIEKVNIQIGQYVAPTTSMFMIVDNEHVHADLMVFEKDVAKVKKGQKVSISVESLGSEPLTAEIYSVGKKFEQNPKAIHVHAELDQKNEYLIPGMYINGKIHASSEAVLALPEDAIVEEAGKPYIFSAEKHQEDGKVEWAFKPIEIRTGLTNDGFVEIRLLKPLPQGTEVAWNGAYYLISEMKKSQTSHGH